MRRHANRIRRNKDLMRFTKVKHLTVLFEINKSVIPKAAESLIKLLLLEKKSVNQVIFYTGNPKKLNIKSQRGRIVFTKKDCNFFYIPKKRIIRQIADYQMDYLIDLNMTDSFPLIYLAGISNARLRIGRQSPARIPFFDLMFDHHEENQQEFARQMLHYLKNMPDSCYII